MTIGASYAFRGPDDVRGVGVIEDSRLLWVDRRGTVERYAEMAVKAYELGARSAMVGAALSLIGGTLRS